MEDINNTLEFQIIFVKQDENPLKKIYHYAGLNTVTWGLLLAHRAERDVNMDDRLDKTRLDYYLDCLLHVCE